MKLDRPLVVFDLETTGAETSTARIVQMAFVKRMPDGSEKPWCTLVNPTIPIPAEATEVHGIDDAQVADAPTFGMLAAKVAAALEGCDFGGYNVRRYDVPVLLAEFVRAGVPFSLDGRRIVDAMAIFHQKEPRDLSAAVKLYTGREMKGAHDALADARASLAVLEGQFARYADLPQDVGALHELCANDAVDLEGKFRWGRDGEPVITFGKHKGKPLSWLVKERGFLSWMLTADFPADTKKLIRDALNNSIPQRKAA